jgi:hypothetical protein
MTTVPNGLRYLNVALAALVVVGFALSLYAMAVTWARKREFWKEVDLSPRLKHLTYARAIRLSVTFVLVQALMVFSTTMALSAPDLYPALTMYEWAYVRRVLISAAMAYCSLRDMWDRAEIVRELAREQYIAKAS